MTEEQQEGVTEDPFDLIVKGHRSRLSQENDEEPVGGKEDDYDDDEYDD